MSKRKGFFTFQFSFRIWLSLKQLVDKGHFEKLRFWGKILGTEKNYYIAEAEQNADEEADGDDEEGAEEGQGNEDGKDDEDEEEEGEDDPLPKSTYKPPPTVPKEERGTGVNKYSYYVCNYRKYSISSIEKTNNKKINIILAGAPWVKLPIVLPAQIAQARQIKHFFTGDLTRQINCYPAYPGTEKNYLRAQIARISATTHVAPAGKFKFSDVNFQIDFLVFLFFSLNSNFCFQEEEEAEEEGGRENFQEDEEYKGTALSQLTDDDLSGWVMKYFDNNIENVDRLPL